MNTTNLQPFDVWADMVAQNDAQRVLTAMEPLLNWLADLHSKGRAHGNIRPSTLEVSNHDFINLKVFETAASQLMNRDSEYAPPEAYDDPRPSASLLGDMYAISAVLYRAISGQSPVRATSRAARKPDTLPMNDVNPGIAQALSKGLSLLSDGRPANLRELRDLLVCSENSLAAFPNKVPEQMKRPHGVELANASNPAIEGTRSEKPAPPLAQTASSSPELQGSLSPAPTTVKRLPINLTVGRAVQIPMAMLCTDPSAWKMRFLNGEELGLSLDDDKQSLTGIPILAGEHELRFELVLPEMTGRPALHRSIAVTVNPDPDSLWKNLASDMNDPYFKPDTEHQDTLTQHARIIAASQRGRSHANEGSFREDDFRIRVDESSAWHLLAAADGAGSAKFSRRGSQIACTTSLAFMEKWLALQRTTLDAAVQLFAEKADGRQFRIAAYQWLAGAAFEARKAIQLEADQKGAPTLLRDYHTTLLLAVAKPTAVGWVIASFSVGDGGIALRRLNGEPKALCSPDSGEFAGQTVFLTASNVLNNAEHVMQRIHIALAPDLSALVLMTDGVTDPKFPTEVSLEDAQVWSAFWSELNAKVDLRSETAGASAKLLDWLSFRSPGNHDDRTIVILLPREPSSDPRSKPAEQALTAVESNGADKTSLAKEATPPNTLSAVTDSGTRPRTPKFLTP